MATAWTSSPKRPTYKAGETARFQVRMPFREATALVTVEREGVLSSFVTKLSGTESGGRGADAGQLCARRLSSR